MKVTCEYIFEYISIRIYIKINLSKTWELLMRRKTTTKKPSESFLIIERKGEHKLLRVNFRETPCKKTLIFII